VYHECRAQAIARGVHGGAKRGLLARTTDDYGFRRILDRHRSSLPRTRSTTQQPGFLGEESSKKSSGVSHAPCVHAWRAVVAAQEMRICADPRVPG
jgi:hypothetical protein